MKARQVISVFLLLYLVSVIVPVCAAADAGITKEPEEMRYTAEQVAAQVNDLRKNSGSGWATVESAKTTLIVAASDSSAAAKSQANYVCSGTSDHLRIQAALDALPASGGTVLLMKGTYNCAGNIQPGAYKTLKGEGESATILKFPGDGGLRIRSNYVTFADFKVTGKADMLVERSNARIHNVTMTVDNSRIGAFYVWAANRLIEDVEFVNCKAIDCGRYGFLNSGEGTPKMIKNIRYINCEAINCGRYSYVSTGPWVTGFDIVEKNDIDGAWIVGCYAEGNQESGFHLEGFYYLSIKNVNFKDCVSVNNAKKGKDACMFGAGFTVPKGCTLENCYSYNNKHGFLISGGSVSQCFDDNFINCTDDSSDYGFMFRHGYDSTFVNCESKNARRQGIVLAKAWNLKVENFHQTNSAGYPVHAGSSIISSTKFAGIQTADDPFAGGMWNGPLTDSTINIHVDNCNSDTVLFFENARNVKVTGSIATDKANPIRVSGGSGVDTSGVLIVKPGTTVPTTPTTPTPTPTPNPSATNIWIEAESGSLTTPMQAASDAAASGGKYAWVPEGNGACASPPAQVGIATCTFSVPVAGEYTIHSRTIAPDSTADSFWVSVDGATAINWAPKNSADWQWNTVAKYQLSAGTHTLKVMWREDGTKIDKILISNDPNSVPSGLGGTATPVPTPTPTPTATPTPTPTPAPGNTLIWLETESASLTAPMQAASDAAASGGKYTWVPNGIGARASPPATEGAATLTFTVPQAGEYTIHGRTIAPDSTADSFWVSVDGATAINWAPKNSADWQWNTVAKYQLSAGTHTLKIMWREDATKIDKVLITSNQSYVPSGMGEGVNAPDPVDTRIRIEAESGVLTKPMLAASDATASGSSYVWIPVGNGARASPPTSGGSAIYTFTVATAGDYAIYGRTIAPDSTADSFWVSVDGATAFNWAPKISQNWQWNLAGTYKLSAGTHTLTIMWREDGTKLDQLEITSDLKSAPA